MDNADDRFTITVHPQGWTFEARASQTLLQAAAQAHIGLPSSCRNGTCRSCMCRLAAGRIEYRIEWPGLSAEEKREGFVLPCVACARSDLVVEAPRALRLAMQKK